MDLAKIRQKARNSRSAMAADELSQQAGLTTAPSFPLDNIPPIQTVITDNLYDDSAFQSLPALPVQNLPVLTAQQAYQHSRRTDQFDPVKAILAGREAAGCCKELNIQNSEPLDREIRDFEEFLCFRVSDEIYGINIMQIKEIIKPRELTDIPRAPSFLSGIISLRGVIIPIIDMPVRLGLVRLTATRKERIVVVKQGEAFSGLQVDEVIQVVKIQNNSFEPPPSVLASINKDFVTGIGRCDGRMIIILNMDKIIDINHY